MTTSTIAAVSTPAGQGGIGVIRISGPEAITIADKIFHASSGRKISDIEGYSALFGKVCDGDDIIDTAIALLFRAPKSYTGEDVVEISSHGGSLVMKKILRKIYDGGAVPAQNGEFTKRAFLNGKLDLTEAESIMGMISASNEGELSVATAAMNGRISREIDEIKNSLLSVAAAIAVYSDYPDEDLPEIDPQNFGDMLTDAKKRLNRMLDNFDAGRVLREGIETAIVGKPNVGKSTLMNLLSGCEKSIVTDIAGTTRDIIEENVMLGGIMLRLSDTAGIRDTDDIVESAGVDRALARIENSQLILAVFDASEKFDSDDLSLLESIKDRKAIAVINKSDKGCIIQKKQFGNIPTVFISAKNGDGTEQLEDAVAKITGVAHLDPSAAVLFNERQRNCAFRAFSAVNEALSALNDGQTVDAVGVCIDDALSAVLELSGERVSVAVTDEIFKRFCVGK